MSSYVTSATDGLLPFSPAFGSSVTHFQYSPSSSRDVLPPSWSHSPLVAAALMYQNGHPFRTPNSSDPSPRLSQGESGEGAGEEVLAGSLSPLKNLSFRQRTGEFQSKHALLASVSARASISSSLQGAGGGDSKLEAPKLTSTSPDWKLPASSALPSDACATKLEGECKGEAEDEGEHLGVGDQSPPGTEGSKLVGAHPHHIEGPVVPAEDSPSGMHQTKSKLSPEVPEFVPRPALTTLPAALNLQKALKGSKGQQLSADVPEFVPMAASTFQPAATFKELHQKTTGQPLLSYTADSQAGSFSTSSASKTNDLPGASRALLLRTISKDTPAGVASTPVLSHTSPSFTPSASTGHISAATVLAVASHAGLTSSGGGLTAVLIPNSVLQGSSLLLSALPLTSTGLPAVDATGQSLAMLSAGSTSFAPASSAGPLASALPLQVSGPQDVKRSPEKLIACPPSSLKSAFPSTQATADEHKANEGSSLFSGPGNASGGKQASLIRASYPSSASQGPLPAGSKLNSSSPEFIPSSLLISATEAPFPANSSTQASADGKRGLAGRSISFTAGSKEPRKGGPAKCTGMRVVENAKDLSRLSPTAPAFTPSTVQLQCEEATQGSLSINLPAEDSLLEDSSLSSRSGQAGSGFAVSTGSQSSGSTSPLSPSASAFTPSRRSKSVGGKSPAGRDAAGCGGKVASQQDLQVLVRLVGELKSPSRDGAIGKDLQKGEERSRGVERLRRALLQHLAQQALLHTSGAEGGQDSGTGVELEETGSSGPASQLLPRREKSAFWVRTRDQRQRPALSAAAKEFVPCTSSTALMSEMALLDPDTLSTSSCDPLQLLESLTEAAAQSRGGKKSSRFFPNVSSAAVPSADPPRDPQDCTMPQRSPRTGLPGEPAPSSTPAAKWCKCSMTSNATSLPWTMALLTSLRMSPPALGSQDAPSGVESRLQEQEGIAQEQSLATALEGVIGAWAQTKEGAEGLLGLFEAEASMDGMERPSLPAIPMRRLADLVLAADADCIDQSPRSQDFSEIEQFLPPDLLDPVESD